jgi:hypothetical protein
VTVLAFVHIEKTAGTTLIHILRKNFFLRHMDVRPLSATGGRELTAGDMRICQRVNPFVASIAGHAVRTYSDLDTWRDDIRYITVLRDPIKRYLSQFQYWNAQLKKDVDFRTFLDDEKTANYQTRQIAGANDIEAAKRVIASKFFAVGVVEEFDEFLVVLTKKMEPMRFDPSYVVQNEGKPAGPPRENLLEEYGDEIRARNASDIELYRYVTEEIIPAQRRAYGPSLEADIAALHQRNAKATDGGVLSYVDYVKR